MRRTLLVVDDNAAFRALARQVLAGDAFDVVGEAATVAEALRLVGQLHPDVVVLDVALPDSNGFDTARVLTSSVAPPAVVLISSRDWGNRSRRTSGSGARGFLPKEQLTAAAVSELVG